MIHSSRAIKRTGTLLLVGWALAIMPSCGGSSSKSTPSPTLSSIAVTPTSPTINSGKTKQFTATGMYSDNSTQNLTSTVTWSSLTPGVATITAGGLATGVTTGSSTITATMSGINGSTLLTVTAPVLVSIAVTPTNPAIAAGTTQQFTAMGTYSNSSTQNLTSTTTWSSLTPGVATITAGGLATGVTTGSSTISATMSGINGSTMLTVTAPVLVSIAVTPANPSIAAGTTQQFTAMGTYSNGSMQNLTSTTTWSSLTPGVATITEGGLATGVTTGSSTISTTMSGINGSTMLTVTAPVLASIAVTPTSPSIAKGTTQQFTATGTYSNSSTQNITTSVTWASSSTSVATIAAGGLATGTGTGTSNITATLGSVVSPSDTLTVTAATLKSIAVTPTSPSIAKGTTQQFTATGTYSDSSTQNITTSVTWASSSTSVATIASDGLATGTGTGTSNITGTLGSIVSPSDTLTVTAATLKSIAVTPTSPSIAKGTTQQFTATGTYSDSSTQNITTSVTWASSSTSVATIASGGLATGTGTGTSNITGTLGSVVSPSDTLTVTAATLESIAVTPTNPSIAKGATQQFTATGTYSDSSTQNITTSVTWASSSTSVATIAAGGLATGAGAGTSNITATLGSIVSPADTLTVSSSSGATLETLVVSPQNPAIADGGATQAFAATGLYSDGSTQNLTSSVVWTSTNTAVATVSASGTATSLTLASGKTAGYTTIQALDGSVTGASILSVTLHTGNGFAGVFTQHNDVSRTGQNVNETTLTTLNVKSGTFGKLFADAVDGYIFAQPLYVPNVAISGGTAHNVIYVTTENDSVYAFDADTGGAALWHASLIDAAHGAATGAAPVSGENDLGCEDLVPNVGSTSTPVIDPSSGTMYVEAESKENGNFIHRLHAIDITSGAEKSQGPVVISATVPGTGDGSSGGSLTFSAVRHLNRPGLLWLNGEVYLGYASLCDTTPYHGWLFAYNAATFTQNAVFVTTPNGSDGGFWNSGSGLAADSNGNLYLASGNGTFDTTNVPATMLGDSIIKINLLGNSLVLEDYFTPYNQAYLSANDEDLGSGGVLLLPSSAWRQPGRIVRGQQAGNILFDRSRPNDCRERTLLLDFVHQRSANRRGSSVRHVGSMVHARLLERNDLSLRPG